MLSEQLQQGFIKLTSHSPFFFAVLDNLHSYCLVNERYSDIAGLSREQLIGMNDTQVLGAPFYQKLRPYYDRALAGEFIEAEISLNETEAETSLHFCLSPVKDESPESYILFQAIDTTEKHILIHSLDEAENRFSQLTRLLPDGLLVAENDFILSANPSAARLLGFNSPQELLGENLSKLFVDEHSSMPLSRPMEELLARDSVVCRTSVNCGIDKKVRLNANCGNLLGKRSLLILIQDADATPKQLSRLSVDDSNIDPLTRLYNRLGFTKRLEQWIKRKTPVLLLYMDIDNFKNINDSLGHHIGDKVIRETATRLKRLLPRRSVIARFGGDEFGILIPNPQSEELADNLSKQIIDCINQPFNLQYFSKRLACSIGSVMYPQDAKNARTLLQNADTAMYEAKERGRNRLIKFNDQMNKEARMRLWLEIELQKALQQNGLEVWYQPKVNARDFSINGAEALVRWKHPIEGYISPGTFIPVAEKTGLIGHLGRVVMREVFNTVKRWKQQKLLPGRVAINLSPEQFSNPQLIDYMQKLLKTTHLDPSCITFELTESAVMSDSQHTLQMLNAIKRLGFALSIDDFGTGYSSLSYLARFPIDELKIDRAFICDIDTLPKQVTVIENIINLGKSLDLTVVAEGVENLQQATLLSNLNCNSIQGFHFYRPLPREEVEALFVHNHRSKY